MGYRMDELSLPLRVDATDITELTTNPLVLIVDLSSFQHYEQQHVPGAIHLDYSLLVNRQPPVLGYLPDAAQLSRVFSTLGLTSNKHVIAYDEEGGAKAARLIWTLDVIGHHKSSLLDGGVQNWMECGLRAGTTPETAHVTQVNAAVSSNVVADKQFILQRLGDLHTQFLDARSPAEFTGQNIRAQRGGHIPGAINVEWTRCLENSPSRRLKSKSALADIYESAGLSKNKEIVTYCHSHHRSAHSYFVLKYLGYPRLRAYPGSWSEWGNDPTTPIETSAK